MTTCPNCKQKLMLPTTMLVGAQVICPQCGEHLRVVGREPVKVELVPYASSLDKNAKPESYA